MNSELIFYLATKTNLCEKALKRQAARAGLSLGGSQYATTPNGLGELVMNSFERANAVFIVGGLSYFDSNGTATVLSRALAGKETDDVKKLRNPLSGSDGYLVRKGGQLIVALPDEPEEIEAIFSGPLFNYLSSYTEF